MTAHFGMKVITDLLRDFSDLYGARFQMPVIRLSFWNENQIYYRFVEDLSNCLSFRNDQHTLPSEWLGPFRHDSLSPMTGPAPSFRKQGGFSSCHIGVRIIFPVISKGIFQVKKPLFYPRFQSPTFLKESLPSEMEKSSQKNFRNLIIPEQKSSLRFWE